MSNCDDMTHFVAVIGGVGEWFKPTVLKTVGLHGPASSNLAPSAKYTIIINQYTKKAGQGYSIEYPLLIFIHNQDRNHHYDYIIFLQSVSSGYNKNLQSVINTHA